MLDITKNSDEDSNKPTEYASTLVSKNITIQDRRTSVRLEPEMWMALNEISLRERCSIHDLCDLVSRRKKEKTSLTAAIRVFLMLYYRSATTEEGHYKAGHGDFAAMRDRANKVEKPKPIYSNHETIKRVKVSDNTNKQRMFTTNIDEMSDIGRKMQL